MTDCRVVHNTTTFDCIVAELINHGIARIFGVLGREASGLSLEALRRVEFIPFRHESTAGFVAEVTARRSQAPQVVMVTLGPGVTNVATAVCSAYLDRSPLILLAAQAESTDLHYGLTHQTIDQVKCFEPITKWAHELTEHDDVQELIREAVSAALAEPPGPVMISVPIDLLSKALPNRSLGTPSKPYRANLASKSVQVCFDNARAQDALRVASKPIVIVGSQVIRLGLAEAVSKSLVECNVPVFTTYNAKGIIPEDSEWSLGTASPYASAIYGFDIFEKAFEACDLVLLIGTDYAEDIRPSLWKFGIPKKIVLASPTPQLYPDSISRGFILSSSILDILRTLRSSIDRRWTHSPLQHRRELITRAIERFSATEDGYANVALLFDNIYRSKKYDLLMVDVGLHRAIAGVLCSAERPGMFLTSMGASTFGFAIPSSIGISLLEPNTRILAICGDAGFHSALPDLDSCQRLGISFDILIVSDGGHGLINLYQQKGQRGQEPAAINCGSARYLALGQAMGFETLVTRDPSIAISYLNKIDGSSKRRVACVETCYPIVTLNESLGGVFRDFIQI